MYNESRKHTGSSNLLGIASVDGLDQFLELSCRLESELSSIGSGVVTFGQGSESDLENTEEVIQCRKDNRVLITEQGEEGAELRDRGRRNETDVSKRERWG